jgi:ribosomal protein S18 acetylase RimI-like enzyme
MTAPLACKFPRPITPFSAVLENSPAAFRDLDSLMEPGEATYVLTWEPPRTDLLGIEGPFGVKQFEWPADQRLAPLPADNNIESLTCADAPAMVALTDVGFPGFFRSRTCEMGPYFGIRFTPQNPVAQPAPLAAMCGERLNLETHHEGVFRELSGLCTHPDHRGRGFAHLLMSKVLLAHRADGVRTYLHAAADNAHATSMYLRMGFILRGEFPLYRVTRNP